MKLACTQDAFDTSNILTPASPQVLPLQNGTIRSSSKSQMHPVTDQEAAEEILHASGLFEVEPKICPVARKS